MGELRCCGALERIVVFWESVVGVRIVFGESLEVRVAVLELNLVDVEADTVVVVVDQSLSIIQNI